MPKQQTRMIRVVFESPPDTDRFHPKEWARFVVVVLFPEAVKRQLGTWPAAKARPLEIAREQVQDRIYKAPDLDALETSVEVVTLDLSPFMQARRTLDDGTKAWLTEAERWHPS